MAASVTMSRAVRSSNQGMKGLRGFVMLLPFSLPDLDWSLVGIGLHATGAAQPGTGGDPLRGDVPRRDGCPHAARSWLGQRPGNKDGRGFRGKALALKGRVDAVAKLAESVTTGLRNESSRPDGFPGFRQDDQEWPPEGGLGIVAQTIAHRGQGVVHLGWGREWLGERGEGLSFQRLAIAGDEGLDRRDRQRPELKARGSGRRQAHQMRCAPLVITLTV